MAFKEKETEQEPLFEIPEGKEIESCKCICDKHGDVTNSSFFFSYNTKNPDGSIQKNNLIFCSICLSSYLLDLQKEGKLGTISLVPILKDKEPVAEESNKQDDDKQEQRTVRS